ncbi:radical SAM protein [Streptomyces sp. NPDC047002]|uniref:radical SAM protein n=1 Tax=Streptomyces sp. NPDC047002 TaxID=3155475 RepID=UPI003451CCA1
MSEHPAGGHPADADTGNADTGKADTGNADTAGAARRQGRAVPVPVTRARRARVTARRRARSLAFLVRTLRDRDRPALAHLVVTRRCNLACTYCNEYDHTSRPVPADRLTDRVDELGRLGTMAVALSGGEPLLHPRLAHVVARIADRGMMAGLITNGYLLSPRRIAALNAARLDFLQISIDNTTPDAVSAKSLDVLDRRLRWLAEYAEFDVTVNSVIGGGVQRATDALAVTERAEELGFSTTLGVIHGPQGTLLPLTPEERDVYTRIAHRGGRLLPFLRNVYTGVGRFQDNLAAGRPNTWQCRAGARYLYVDETGAVHRCSQTRTGPGTPLAQYTVHHIREEFTTPKACAPFCTVGCVHRVARLDSWRSA